MREDSTDFPQSNKFPSCSELADVGGLASSWVTSTLNCLLLTVLDLDCSGQSMEPGMKIRVRLGPKLLRAGLSEKSLRLEEQILQLIRSSGVNKKQKTHEHRDVKVWRGTPPRVVDNQSVLTWRAPELGLSPLQQLFCLDLI